MNSRILQAVTPRAPIARSIAAIAIAALFVASCDVHKLSNPGFVTSIDIIPNPVTLAVTGTRQFSVIAKDFSGATIEVSPTWSVVASGGTIASDGVFTAGTTPQTFPNTVMATVGGLTATATVIVIPGPLASIIVTPKPVTLGVDLSQQFTALGLDAVNNVVPLTPVWSVVNAVAGSIGTAGLFTAGTTPGAFANTVKASSGLISGTATVNVTAGALTTITVSPNPQSLVNGATQQYAAVGKDAGGNVVAITPNWAVVAGGGSIVAASGLFTAGATAGTFANTVQASVGSVAGFATVVVTSGALASITVTPNPVAMQTSTTQQFVAAGKDAGGNNFLITPVWSIVSGGGSIDPNTGVFTSGAAAGAALADTVKATSGLISGTAAITVTLAAPVLASITVVPNPVTLLANATQQFAAVGKDASGNVIALSPTWSVADPLAGTIGLTGLFTAGTTIGTFANTVTATSGLITGTATVNVVTGPLASITVTPNPVSLQTNGTQQFVAVGKDVNGNNFLITPVWSVVNLGGTIDPNTGVFTAGVAPGTFTNTVKATSGSISATATVTVVLAAPILATITVTPNPASMLPNATQQFAAVGRDGSGTLFPIAPVWTVVNGGGSINVATGLFTAGPFVGTFTNTVKATSGTVSGTATVNVTAPPAPPLPIADLKTAALNGIMAGTAFTCVIGGFINADISISPGSTVTGFPPCVITGTQHLNDAIAIQNQLDLIGAYNTLAGLPCSAANTIGTTDIGGTTKAAGVYCSASSIGVTGTLTLDGGGDPNANFVFQAGSGLTTAGNVVLINGAQAKNVWWQVGSSATIGTGSQWKGNIVALTSITLVDNATLIGRALARNGAVSQGTNNVIILP